MPLEVLYEDNHLLVVNKPPGLPTMGVAPDEPSAWREARTYIKHRYQKPGNVYLGVVSRLDRAASGVVVFARTSKAASRLAEQYRSRTTSKTYWAVVEGTPPPAAELIDHMLKDEAARRMRVCPATAPGAQLARLTLKQVAAAGGGTLLEIQLETGRKHQIRLQLSSRGYAVVGDTKYGSRTPLPAAAPRPAIALHARRVELAHPVGGEPLVLRAEVPRFWRAFRLPVG